ncbi:TRAPP complex subunit bet5 [Peniophora sp. CONT]|nr:TRAPP complex subunit bet5 [Peniophora sp. CONT]
MTIFSLYIYDRHCNCVYYQDWHRTRRPKPSAADGALLPAVSRAMTAPAPAQQAEVASPYNSPRNTLGSNSGVVIALNDGGAIPPWLQDHREAPHTLLQTPQTPVAAPASSALPFDEEAKLVYGVILSLRNMIKRLSGRDEQFVAYKTSAYKMHMFETLSGFKFVMLSDPGQESLRAMLFQIYTGPFIEYVVRNPLVRMDSRERGIDNEYFRASIDRMVRGTSVFA